MSPHQVRRYLEEQLQEAEIRARYWDLKGWRSMTRMWQGRVATLTRMLAQLPA